MVSANAAVVKSRKPSGHFTTFQTPLLACAAMMSLRLSEPKPLPLVHSTRTERSESPIVSS